MKRLFEIKTQYGEDSNFASYNVLATTAEEAIEKLTPKLDGEGPELVEEITVLGIVEIE